MNLRALLILLLLLPLAACATRNPARVELCLTALAGLVPGDGRIAIESVAGEEQVITVFFRDPSAARLKTLDCSFEGTAISINQLNLTDVVFDETELGPGRLTYLKSHWLTGAGNEALAARIAKPVTGFFAMPPGAGRYMQSALSALPTAAVYMLLALGFALIHGITGRMNIAHGEFATVGAHAGYMGFLAFGVITTTAGMAGAIVFALVAAAAAGFLTIRAVFIPLARQQGLMLLVASVGLILVYEETLRLSRDSREIWLPPLMSEPMALTLPPYVVTVTPMTLFIALAATGVTAAVLVLIRFSRFGKAWRAVSDDPLAARFMGIDPARILAVSAMLASGLAGLAGLFLLMAFGNATHSMGLMLSFKAMVAALIGGMGSPVGAVLGALTLAGIETFWSVMFGGNYRDLAVFTLMIGLLTLRRDGLLGLSR